MLCVGVVWAECGHERWIRACRTFVGGGPATLEVGSGSLEIGALAHWLTGMKAMKV